MSLLFPRFLHGDSFATDDQPTGIYTFTVEAVQPINSRMIYVSGRFTKANLIRGFVIDLMTDGIERSTLTAGKTLTVRLRRQTKDGRLLSTVREVE